MNLLIPSVEIFQFLMVRLKGTTRQLTWKIKRTFQFLMVRLKEINNIKNFNEFEKISIPYGAIKRKIQHFFTRTKSKKFQFLMVRLKDLIEFIMVNI